MKAADRVQHLAESNEDEDQCQPAEEQEAPGAVGAWGLGSGTMPLSPELMCEPPFTLDLQQDIEDWLLRLGELVAHDPSSLPFGSNTDYDEPCFPGACRSDPHFDQALSLLRSFTKGFEKRAAADAYLLVGEGADVTLHRLFLLALRHDGGTGRMVFLRLGHAAALNDWDIESGTN